MVWKAQIAFRHLRVNSLLLTHLVNHEEWQLTSVLLHEWLDDT